MILAPIQFQGLKGRPVSTGMITCAGATVVAYTAYKGVRDLRARRRAAALVNSNTSNSRKTKAVQQLFGSSIPVEELEKDWFRSVEWCILYD